MNNWKKTLTIAGILAASTAFCFGGCGSASSDAQASGSAAESSVESVTTDGGSTSSSSYAYADSSESVTSSSNAEGKGSGIAASVTELRDLKPVTKDDVHIEYDQYYEDDELTLEITEGNDAVKSVHFLLFLQMNDPGEEMEYVYLGEDNNMVGDYETGKFTNNFSGYWATVDGRVVTTEIIEETDEYNLYSIPCIIDGERTSIRAMYDLDAGEFRILGRYDGVDTEANSHMTSRGVRKIEDGSQVVFTMACFEGEDFEESEYQMKPISWSDDVEMQDEDLGDGTYMFMYEIEDVFGNEIDADPAELEVSGDNMQWVTVLGGDDE